MHVAAAWMGYKAGCLLLRWWTGLVSRIANWMFICLQVLDGHNGNAAAIYTRDNLLNHVLSAMPQGLSREEWLHALPRALVAGFVKTDKEFQSKGMIPLLVFGVYRCTKSYDEY